MRLAKKAFLLIGDTAILYFALIITLAIRYGGVATLPLQFSHHAIPFLFVFPFWLLSYYWSDLYRLKTLRDQKLLLRSLFQSTFLAVLISILLFYLFPIFFEITPKTNLFILGFLSIVFMYVWRTQILSLFIARADNVVLLGDSPTIKELEHFLITTPHSGFKVFRRFSSEDEFINDNGFSLVKNSNVHLVVVERNFSHNISLVNSLYALIPLEISVMRLSDFYEIIFEREPIDELGEEWFIQNISQRRPIFDFFKRLFDIALSALLLILFLPFSLLIALTITATSKGPIIYKQLRIGKNGAPFTIFKFRSMFQEAAHDGPQWNHKENDPRVTPIGKILRYTHLDEVPQLWNIMRGDCSFVGPRPEWIEFAKVFEREIPFYEMRHIVRPGITGHAQVNCPYGTSVENGKEKLSYDIFYIRSRSFLTDVFIILRTIKLIFVKLI